MDANVNHGMILEVIDVKFVTTSLEKGLHNTTFNTICL